MTRQTALARRFALIVIMLGVVPSMLRASIEIESTTTEALARYGSTAPVTRQSLSRSLPIVINLDADVSPIPSFPGRSQVRIDWQKNGNNTSLFWGFSQERSGLPQSVARTFVDLHFTVDHDSTYTLVGNYDLNSITAGGNFFLLGMLQDLTSSQILFDNFQQSYGTPDERFVLGGTGGDQVNILSGALHGELLAGHRYRLLFDASTVDSNQLGDDQGGTATGNLSLQIIKNISQAQVPEAASLCVWSGLAGCLGLVYWRRARFNVQEL